MSIYKLAIVGRANVGKSSLFNRICKKKIAIVHEREGVTRDRIQHIAYIQEKPFYVIDTAGLEVNKNFSLIDEINIQTQIAIEQADVLVMVVDAKVGITALDENVAKNLLKTKKRVLLAVNKIDSDNLKDKLYDFNSLGISEMIDISCTQNNNIEKLVELAFTGFKFDENYGIEKEDKIKVAIVGKTNVGKSTLLNILANDQRSIVSETVSTTRDSVDVDIKKGDVTYTFVDTAGIRRKNKEHDILEKFSHSQAIKNIEKAHICLLVVDAVSMITNQDKKILKIIEKNNKGCIILINKWDKIKNIRQEHFLKAQNQKNNNYSMLIISALKKMNVEKIFSQINQIDKNRKQHISTPVLNKFVEKCILKYHPPMIFGKRLKIYYLTQIRNNPPKFLFFVNNPKLFTDTYKRYLMNNFRDNFDLKGTSIIFDVKQKS